MLHACFKLFVTKAVTISRAATYYNYNLSECVEHITRSIEMFFLRSV